MGRPSKLHKVRGQWRCRIDGKPYTWKTESEARQGFYTLMAQRAADKASPDKPHTVAGAVDKWITIHAGRYQTWLPPFIEYAGRLPLRDPGRDVLVAYHRRLQTTEAKRRIWDSTSRTWSIQGTGRTLGPGTIRHYMQAATGVLRWAFEQGWMDYMPRGAKLDASPKRPRDIEPERLTDTLSRLPATTGRILRFIASCGCRPSEAIRLTWADVHLDASICTLPAHKTARKTGKPRTIYLTPEAKGIIEDLLPHIGKPSGTVFKSALGKAYASSKSLSEVLKKYGGFTAYSLRHSFAQAVLDEQPMEVVAALLGHANLAQVQTYCQIRDRRASAAAASIKPRLVKAG